ncbi:glutamate mutase subunit E [Stackebrandtia albiflava]|uniref:Glutamate mutase subunit E n=1 Tax=Stackebrandtia albiflava TaxID=406432 RepID=A0A562VBX6_9ACTN|nr:methylaspartate mutase [Stackebrandtia albiflava]TWJ15362.1 glutamate mutase subunit E [Stackebrandtia albiflava]
MTIRPNARTGRFHDFMVAARRDRRLVVQPRMGFDHPAVMRSGLIATRGARATTVGTLTLDSFTRVGDFAAVDRALDAGTRLNGYPIVNYGPAFTRAMLDGVLGADFPIQVRHGSSLPGRIFEALIASGIDASEGGPVSYCLPYGRTPLRRTVAAWRAAGRGFAALREQGVEPHIETFGGCMLGQLCPPAMLVAISVLEGLFFARLGIASVSLSYAQQTHPGQDAEAIAALGSLAAELLPGVEWHIVLYTYMGMYPETRHGALGLVADAARLAAGTGCSRLIVKTAAEADRIPTIAENVEALEVAARAAEGAPPIPSGTDTGILDQARRLVDAVLGLSGDVGAALIEAFAKGYLDIPYCLHPDNAGDTASLITGDGRLEWSRTGALPIPRPGPARRDRLTSRGLLDALSHVKRRYDARIPPQPKEIP